MEQSMRRAFSKAIQEIKARPPKPTVSGMEFAKYSIDGLKIGIELPIKSSLPGTISNAMVNPIGTYSGIVSHTIPIIEGVGGNLVREIEKNPYEFVAQVNGPSLTQLRSK